MEEGVYRDGGLQAAADGRDHQGGSERKKAGRAGIVVSG